MRCLAQDKDRFPFTLHAGVQLFVMSGLHDAAKQCVKVCRDFRDPTPNPDPKKNEKNALQDVDTFMEVYKVPDRGLGLGGGRVMRLRQRVWLGGARWGEPASDRSELRVLGVWACRNPPKPRSVRMPSFLV